MSDQPVDLIADGVDCVLRIGNLPPSSLIARKLAMLTMVVCASPAYLAAHGTPKTIADLTGHRAVNYVSGRGHRPISWSLPDGPGVSQITLPSGILVNDTEAFVTCALNGMGLIQVTGLNVAEHLAKGTLVEILPEMRAISWPLSVMYPNRQHLAPQVRAFMDWLAELVQRSASEWLHPISSV